LEATLQGEEEKVREATITLVVVEELDFGLVPEEGVAQMVVMVQVEMEEEQEVGEDPQKQMELGEVLVQMEEMDNPMRD
jgi:hypothetical protein